MEASLRLEMSVNSREIEREAVILIFWVLVIEQLQNL